MKVRVTSPDGRVRSLNVPDDATDEQIVSFAQQTFAQAAEEAQQPFSMPPAAPEQMGNTEGVLQNVAQGATFGLADELQAGIGAGYAKLFGGDAVKGQSYSDLANESEANQRRQMQGFYEENPKTAIGANVAGSLLTLQPSLAAAQALKIPSAGLRGGAATGVAFGAAGGAGAAPEGETLEGALTGGAIGGTIGAGVHGIPPLVGFVKGLGLNASAKVQSILKKGMEATGKSVDELEAYIKSLGPGIALADVDKAFRQMMAPGAKLYGKTAKNLEKLIKRDEGQFERLTAPMHRMFGGEARTWNTLGELKNVRKTESNPLYEEAYAAPFELTAPIRKLLNTPAAKEAWAVAKKAMRNDPKSGEKPMGEAVWKVGKGGKLYQDLEPNLRGLNFLTRILNDESSKLYRAEGAKSTVGKGIGNLRRALLTEMDKGSEVFEKARGIWAGTLRAEEMIAEGGKFLTKTRGQVARDLEGMSGADRQFYIGGLAEKIESTMAKAKLSADPALSFNTPAFKEKMRATLPDSADEFLAAINSESEKHLTSVAARSAGNSAAEAAMTDMIGGPTSASTFSPAGHMARVVNFFRRGGKAKTADELGNLVSSMDPEDIALVMKILRRAEGQTSSTAKAGPWAANLAAQQVQ